MDIVLKQDDVRFGKYAPDGSFAEWPTADVFGGAYEKINATVRRIDATRFVVVPPSRDSEIETLTVEKSQPTQTFIKPKASDADGEK